VGLEQGPFSLLSTVEELLERKSSSSSLENQKYGIGIHHADHATPSIRKKLTLTSLIRGGRSGSTVRSQGFYFRIKNRWRDISFWMIGGILFSA
jgi:hypothetical protein